MALLTLPASGQAAYLMAGGDAARAGDLEDAGPGWDDLAWTVDLPGCRANRAAPIILNGSVYVLMARHEGPDEGEDALWRIPLQTGVPERIASLPSVPHGFASDGNHFYVSDRTSMTQYTLTGERGWRSEHYFPTGADESVARTCTNSHFGNPTREGYDYWPGFCDAPVVDRGVVYVGCIRYHGAATPGGDPAYSIPGLGEVWVNGFDVADGRMVFEWVKDLSEESLCPNALVCFKDEYTGVGGTGDGFLTGFSVVGENVLVATEDQLSPPTVFPGLEPDSTFVHGVYENHVWAVNRSTASWSWTWVEEGRVPKTNADTVVPTGDADHTFVKFEHVLRVAADSGEEEKRDDFRARDTPSLDHGGRMALAAGRLYAFGSQAVVAYDPETLQPLWRQVPIHDAHRWAPRPPLVTEDAIYAMTFQEVLDGTGIAPGGHQALWALDPEDGTLLWSREFSIPDDPTYPWMSLAGMAHEFAVGDGFLAVVNFYGNVTLLGRTPVSPVPIATLSSTYPAVRETVHVDLADSTGVRGKPDRFRVDWGDGNATQWQASPEFDHRYTSKVNRTLRYEVANAAGQSASGFATVYVGQEPPAEAAQAQAAVPFFSAANKLSLILLGLLLVALLAVVLFAAWLWRRYRLNRMPLTTRFRIEKELGRGSTSRALLAFDTVHKRKVVLKQPLQNVFIDAKERRRFLREARLLARVRHGNVVAVQEVFMDRDVPVLVLEYVPGGSLADLLRKEGRLKPERALDLGLGILAGLAAIHRTGTVHRDLKPANILLDAKGAPKVTDFGVARAPPNVAATVTVDGNALLMGSPAYMSPEQADKGTVDARSDLYSFGAVLYEALTGRRRLGNVEGELAGALAGAARDDADLARPLARVLARLLEPHPADRYADADEAAAALRRAGQELGHAAPSSTSRPTPVAPAKRVPT